MPDRFVRLPPLRPVRQLLSVRAAWPLSVLLLAATVAAQLTGALLPHAGLLIGATAAGSAADLLLHQYQRPLAGQLAKLRADATVRQLTRDTLLLAGLAQLAGPAEAGGYLLPAFGLLACYALHFTVTGLAALVRRTRTLPVLTRNLDPSGLRLSPAPPVLLMRRHGDRVLWFSAPATAGLLTGPAVAGGVLTAAGVGLSLALYAAGAALLAARLLPGRRPVGEQQALAWLDARLAEYRPATALYFSGGAGSAYQANMWLGTLAESGERPIILLRERAMVQKIGATDLPVVCIPKAAHLLRLEHSTLRVVIHPSNSGKTSHILRIPTLLHAFVNHGESDKLSSCNPYAKAYDEVWVAGPAARSRYALADVGVEDRDIVEVGRPQLAPVRPYSGPPADRPLTVLYAPTWEGWTDTPGDTSLLLAGETVVRTLLADPGVRVLYKPHPLTGTVDPRMARAHERITALLTGAAPADGPEPSALEPLTRELEHLTAQEFRRAADSAERMLRQGVPEPGRAKEVAEVTAAWEDAYWASRPAGAHRVITGSRPGLYSCFNQTDLLITDVSSVLSDYLAAGKPYAVVNTGELDERDFRAAYPTVRAAAVLTADASGLPWLLRSVRDPGLDPFTDARGALRELLLGPVDPPSPARFAQALRGLLMRAESRGAVVNAPVPAQRAMDLHPFLHNPDGTSRV